MVAPPVFLVVRRTFNLSPAEGYGQAAFQNAPLDPEWCSGPVIEGTTPSINLFLTAKIV